MSFMTDLLIKKKDESYLILEGEASILQELNDLYTFFTDGYKFHPKYRSRQWDGKIRLLKRKSQNCGEIYYGLLSDIIKYCIKRDYKIELSKELITKIEYNDKELLQYIQSLKLSSKGQLLNLRDYQIKGIIDSIKYKRQLLLSITSSGKSLVLYAIIRYLLNNNNKILLLVPNVSLIHQMVSDFSDYSLLNKFDSENNIHVLYSGQEKDSNKPLYISTWQSLSAYLRNPNTSNKAKQLLSSFDAILGDECFAKGTKVLTTSGYKNIENIVPGEKIINYDEVNKKFKVDEVVKLHTNISNKEKMFEMNFDDGKTLRVTGNHKFLTTVGWIRADELNTTYEIINYEIII